MIGSYSLDPGGGVSVRVAPGSLARAPAPAAGAPGIAAAVHPPPVTRDFLDPRRPTAVNTAAHPAAARRVGRGPWSHSDAAYFISIVISTQNILSGV
jgi:hypothetical protein